MNEKVDDVFSLCPETESEAEKGYIQPFCPSTGRSASKAVVS